MKYFTLLITVYFYLYTVIFFYLGVKAQNNNALIMGGIMLFFSIIITKITIKNFKI